MKAKKKSVLTLAILLFFAVISLQAQISSGIYISDLDNVRHELKVTKSYIIHTVFEKSPAKFIKTIGGFYTTEGETLHVKLEFNSDYETDSISSLTIPYTVDGDQLTLDRDPKLVFNHFESFEQELDGQWLFATRGPDEGQDRRGEENPRKTLKYLQGNRFQWVAYNTETFKFHGTGGGSYSSEGGIYTEKIDFFSRDDSRVGAELKFDYELNDGDWHHTGLNSKGEPLYEIWAKRR